MNKSGVLGQALISLLFLSFIFEISLCFNAFLKEGILYKQRKIWNIHKISFYLLFQSLFQMNIFVIVAQLLTHVWLCNPMDCSTPGFPALPCLLEFAQIHLHQIVLVMLFNPLILCCTFLFFPKSFPASGSFPMSRVFFPMTWLFASGGQNIGASASALPANIEGWFPLGLTGLTSLQFKGISRTFSSTTISKYQFFRYTQINIHSPTLLWSHGL